MEQPSYFCRVCDIAIGDSDGHRKHVKSEWHVYRLQCKLAPVGQVIAAPRNDACGPTEKDPKKGTTSSSKNYTADEDDASEEIDVTDEDTEDENSQERQGPDFVNDQCLFCHERSGTFDANVAHMSSTHSLIIPYRKYLSVDFETLIWYLHFVVYGYRECILCGTRRSTIDAVKQHMVAKGHCRFDLSGDFADFYDMPKTSDQAFDELVRADESSIRLPSGKLLAHRTQTHQTIRQPPSRISRQQPQELPRAKIIPSASNALERKDRKAGTIITQISKLSASDQRSLIHLTAAEQRSALSTRKKHLDMARREERRAQLRVERLGNRTLMKHFKPDVPGPSNG